MNWAQGWVGMIEASGVKEFKPVTDPARAPDR